MANRNGVPRNFKKIMESMGIQELKSKQIELLESFVSGRNTFILDDKSIILVEVAIASSYQSFLNKGHTLLTSIHITGI